MGPPILGAVMLSIIGLFVTLSVESRYAECCVFIVLCAECRGPIRKLLLMGKAQYNRPPAAFDIENKFLFLQNQLSK